MKVTRYTMMLIHCNGAEMEEANDGEYVSHEDYVSLESERNAMYKRIRDLETQLALKDSAGRGNW